MSPGDKQVGQTYITHRRSGTNIFHTQEGGTNIFTLRGGDKHFHLGGGQTFFFAGDGLGFDDVAEETDVSEANFLVSAANIFVSEASKPSAGP